MAASPRPKPETAVGKFLLVDRLQREANRRLDDAVANGFEQIPYGRFDGPFLRSGKRATDRFLALWADHPQPLSFRFGYPDRALHNHLLITRPRVP